MIKKQKKNAKEMVNVLMKLTKTLKESTLKKKKKLILKNGKESANAKLNFLENTVSTLLETQIVQIQVNSILS